MADLYYPQGSSVQSINYWRMRRKVVLRIELRNGKEYLIELGEIAHVLDGLSLSGADMVHIYQHAYVKRGQCNTEISSKFLAELRSYMEPLLHAQRVSDVRYFTRGRRPELVATLADGSKVRLEEGRMYDLVHRGILSDEQLEKVRTLTEQALEQLRNRKGASSSEALDVADLYEELERVIKEE